MVIESTRAVTVFFSYAQEDEDLCKALEMHLGSQIRSKEIMISRDRDIRAETSQVRESGISLNSADLILLLISHHFINSDRCYNIEMPQAMQRYKDGTARLIPIILRPVAWETSSISDFTALPDTKKPITEWPRRDSAFFNVVRGIRKVVEELRSEHKKANEANTSNVHHTIDTHEAILLFHRLMEDQVSVDALDFRIFYLTGQKFMGKTHLLKNVFSEIAQDTYYARPVHIDLGHAPISSIPDILNAICDQLGSNNCSLYSRFYPEIMGKSKGDLKNRITQSSSPDASEKTRLTTEHENARLTSHLVADLRKLVDNKLVFFFDHFDFAKEQIQTWLIDSFLRDVPGLSHIRVVVAGRILPKASGAFVDHHQTYQLSQVKDDTEYTPYYYARYGKMSDIDILRSCIDKSNYIPGMVVLKLFENFGR